MTTSDLFQEIETLSPVQLKSVCSFVHQLKHPNYITTSSNGTEQIEPFVNEKDATEFANYYAGIILNETR